VEGDGQEDAHRDLAVRESPTEEGPEDVLRGRENGLFILEGSIAPVVVEPLIDVPAEVASIDENEIDAPQSTGQDEGAV
jgi:hypothetical protein